MLIQNKCQIKQVLVGGYLLTVKILTNQAKGITSKSRFSKCECTDGYMHTCTPLPWSPIFYGRVNNHAEILLIHFAFFVSDSFLQRKSFKQSYWNSGKCLAALLKKVQVLGIKEEQGRRQTLMNHVAPS